jgi:hypothetical protein
MDNRKRRTDNDVLDINSKRKKYTNNNDIKFAQLKKILDMHPKMSICIGDGLLYANNAGMLFRSLKAFGCDCFIMCPPTNETYDKLVLCGSSVSH